MTAPLFVVALSACKCTPTTTCRFCRRWSTPRVGPRRHTRCSSCACRMTRRTSLRLGKCAECRLTAINDRERKQS